jgi:hypothetical protein
MGASPALLARFPLLHCANLLICAKKLGTAGTSNIAGTSQINKWHIFNAGGRVFDSAGGSNEIA